jgi:O-antigen ligase
MTELVYGVKLIFIAVLLALTYLSKPTAYWKFAQVMATFNPGIPWLPLSGTHLWTVIAHPAARRSTLSGPRNSWVGGILLFILAAYLLALFWSPDPFQSLRFVASTVTLYFLTLAVRRSEGGPLTALRSVVRVTVPVSVVQALSTILFMVLPGVEASYLKSNLAPFLLGQRASLLYSTMPDNVIFDDKSGGLLFYNGNTASMVMGVWAICITIVAFQDRSKASFLAAFICLMGAFATGSKSGILLSVLIPLFVGLTIFLSRGSKKLGPLILATVTLAFGLLVLPAFRSQIDTYFMSSDNSSRARDLLWAAAGTAFEGSPFFGLGWGGWEQFWPVMSLGTGLMPSLPPHNFLIQTWAQAGLLPVIAILLLFAISFLRLSKQAIFAIALDSSRTAALSMGVLAWIFFHGMYDATAFYGVEALLPLVACILGMTKTNGAIGDSSGREKVETACP